ncbi:MAG: hypothetical protein OXE05_13180 [Chloroflexi bacterium]|nr:hypothetical protein [Chloroflexota bacterium]
MFRALLLGFVLLFALFSSSAHAFPGDPPRVCNADYGFQAIYELIPGTVGSCMGTANYNDSGDVVQQTANRDKNDNIIFGLFVWRQADNRAVFTDGARTWIIDPKGVLQSRPNSEAFAWEGTPVPTPTPKPTPVPPVPPPGEVAPITDPDLVRVFDLLRGDATGRHAARVIEQYKIVVLYLALPPHIPSDTSGYYTSDFNTIVLNALMRGDDNATAATIIHETYHAEQYYIRAGYERSPLECLQEEVDAFRLEAKWLQSRQPDNFIVGLYLNGWVLDFVLVNPAYQELCLGGTLE